MTTHRPAEHMILPVAPITDECKQAVICRLQEMDAQGQLHYPDPWINVAGDEVVAWGEDDGPVVACYIDMLGLW